MPFITYPQPNGQVAVIIPADPSLSIEEIAAKDVPEGLPYKIVDSLEIENDYFNAYEFHADNGAEVNIDKAKQIHLDKFRAARAPKLAALDVQYLKAIETEDSVKASEIAVKKQELRDVTKTPLPETLGEIKAVWPEILN
jgi:predicted metal-dependent hydrolase